jgi:hypothetical protein
LEVVKTCAIWLVATLLLWTLAASAAANPPPVRPGAPVSAHAMVHTCCTPPAMKERIFAEAKAMGARRIRVDVELGGIFGAGAPDWARLDEVLELSRRYELPVLGILRSPPISLPVHDAQGIADLAGQVAAHARDTIVHWEVFNEPNAEWGFSGTPEDYARVLRAAHDAIKARVPEAKVVLGAMMVPHGPPWLSRVVATPGADAVHAFDIAAVNLRDAARRLPGQMAAWRTMLAGLGFNGPLWITEHGYPADSTFQSDPAFQGGETAQARFLTEGILGLGEAGADEVFVTLRDNVFLADPFFNQFLTEGVVAIADAAPHPVRRKPAFAAVRRVVDNWDALLTARAEQRQHEAAMRLAGARADAASRRANALRARVRSAVGRLARLRARHRAAQTLHARRRLRRQVVIAAIGVQRRRTSVEWMRALAQHYRLRAAVHQQRATELAAFVAGG